MAGRKHDPFTTLGDDAFPPDDDPGNRRDDEYRSLRGDEFNVDDAPKEVEPKQSKPNKPKPRDDEFQSLRPDEFDFESVGDLEKTPSTPVFKDRKGSLPVPDPRGRAKPKDQFTRVGQVEPQDKPVSQTPKGLGETTAPDDLDDPNPPAAKKSLLATPAAGAPSKHVVDLKNISKSVHKTGRGGIAPQSGDDLAALLLDYDIVTSEDWQEALDKVDNNLNNIPAILKQLSQQKASWTEEYPEHYPALTEYQVREIWAGRGLGLRACGQFVILDELGEGGMGKVYKARGLGEFDSPRFYAIKTIRSESDSGDTNYGTPSSSTVGRFRKEADILAKLRHPNLPVIYISGMSMDRVPYIVMDFLKGPTLEKIVEEHKEENKPVDFKWATRQIIAIADVLHHAHSHKGAQGDDQPVIHRDIKPANVIMQDGKTPMLVDLGIAKLSSSQATKKGAVGETMAKGSPLGTPAYMPFEQYAEAQSVTPAADVYSLAGTYYNLLTGELPFPADDAQSLMYKVMTADRPKVTPFRKDVPKEVDAILERAMAIKPEDRYQTAQEFANALRAFVAEPTGFTPVQKVALAVSVLALAAVIALVVPPILAGSKLEKARNEATAAFEKAKQSNSPDDWKATKDAYVQLAQTTPDADELALCSVRQARASLALGDWEQCKGIIATGISDGGGIANQDGLVDAIVDAVEAVPNDKVSKPVADVVEITTSLKEVSSPIKAKLASRMAKVFESRGDWENAIQRLKVCANANAGEKMTADAAARIRTIYQSVLTNKDGRLSTDQLIKLAEQARTEKWIDQNASVETVSDAYLEGIDIEGIIRIDSVRKAAPEKLKNSLAWNRTNDRALQLSGVLSILEGDQTVGMKFLEKVGKELARDALMQLAKHRAKETEQAKKFLDEAIKIDQSLPKEKQKGAAEYKVLQDEIAAALIGKIPDELLNGDKLNDVELQRVVKGFAERELRSPDSNRVHAVYQSPKLPQKVKLALAPFASISFVRDATRQVATSPDKAMTLARSAIDADKANYAAYRLMRDLIVAQKRGNWIADAVRQLELFQAAGGSLDPEEKPQWARLYYDFGSQALDGASTVAQRAEVKDRMTKAIALDPTLTMAYIDRAKIELAQGDLAAAGSDLDLVGARGKLSALESKQWQLTRLRHYAAVMSSLKSADGEGELNAAVQAWNEAKKLATAGAAGTSSEELKQKFKPVFLDFAVRQLDGRNAKLATSAFDAVNALDPAAAAEVDCWKELIKLAELKSADPVPDAQALKAKLNRVASDDRVRDDLRRRMQDLLLRFGDACKVPSNSELLLKAYEAYVAAESFDVGGSRDARKDRIYKLADSLARRVTDLTDGGFVKAKTDLEGAIADAETALKLSNYALKVEDRQAQLVRLKEKAANGHLVLIECLAAKQQYAKAFEEAAKAANLAPEYKYSQIYKATAGRARLVNWPELTDDTTDLARVLLETTTAAIAAMRIDSKELEPGNVLRQLMLMEKRKDGNARLLMDCISTSAKKKYVVSTISAAKDAFEKIKAIDSSSTANRAELAFAIAFLRTFGGEPDYDDGNKFAKQAVDLSAGKKFWPLYLQAKFQIGAKLKTEAEETLLKAESATDTTEAQKALIQKAREEITKIT